MKLVSMMAEEVNVEEDIPVPAPPPPLADHDQPIFGWWDIEGAAVPTRFDPLRVQGGLRTHFNRLGYRASGIHVLYAEDFGFFGSQASDRLINMLIQEHGLGVNATVTPAFFLVIASDGGYLNILWRIRLADFTTGIMYVPGSGTLGLETGFGAFLHGRWRWHDVLAESPHVNPALYGLNPLARRRRR